jgi:hypothetical protein
MRVAFDNNVWSYLANGIERPRLESFIQAGKITLHTPPATLLEILQTNDIEHRRKIVDLICSPRWKRMRTEVQQECGEFVDEALRLRPQWIRSPWMSDAMQRQEKYWTKTIWKLAQRPEHHTRLATHLNLSDRDLVFEVQKRNRQEIRDNVPWHKLDLSGWSYGAPADGQVDPWRVDNHLVYWDALRTYLPRLQEGKDTTIADWIVGHIWLQRVLNDPADLTRFWLHEVEAARMPRNWLRWAVTMTQNFSKINKGSPVDVQHASYLPDCDIFVTGDKRFATALNTVREQAPFPMAETRIVTSTSGEPMLDELAAVLHIGNSSHPRDS